MVRQSTEYGKGWKRAGWGPCAFPTRVMPVEIGTQEDAVLPRWGGLALERGQIVIGKKCQICVGGS